MPARQAVSDEPPRDMKGRVMPVKGSKPEMAAVLINACMAIHDIMPLAK